MADEHEERRKDEKKDPSLHEEDKVMDGTRTTDGEEKYLEETAAEPAGDERLMNHKAVGPTNMDQAEGTGMGWLALALSIVALFFLPVIMGAAGIIIGFIARRQGAGALGGWAIGIGAAAILITLFAAPLL
ncbi:hypothetical protein [Tuberibacillus sp. Marseille-P3662]|uniref:hypothetical protein n=1 Tax=Tuberibacillus sp. Marseille-P3662 TaxID=1965358 RepID=UPI000A1CD2FE|nr:hypothetical protein [Tuberibacillus sp. Marseille-P3662]